VGVGLQSQVLAFSLALIGVDGNLIGDGGTFSLGWIPKILSARVYKNHPINVQTFYRYSKIIPFSFLKIRF
jgi:hypothetical protein